jgi:hypothetical protein
MYYRLHRLTRLWQTKCAQDLLLYTESAVDIQDPHIVDESYECESNFGNTASTMITSWRLKPFCRLWIHSFRPRREIFYSFAMPWSFATSGETKLSSTSYQILVLLFSDTSDGAASVLEAITVRTLISQDHQPHNQLTRNSDIQVPPRPVA